MEKVFIVPLRPAFRTSRTKRAAKAIKVVREFLQRHMKAEKILIGSSINHSVWARGIQKIPRRIRIHADKDDKDVVRAEMMGVEIKIPKEKEEKKEEKAEEKKAVVPMKPPEPKKEKPKKAKPIKKAPEKKKGKK